MRKKKRKEIVYKIGCIFRIDTVYLKAWFYCSKMYNNMREYTVKKKKTKISYRESLK
jgi:hypothetical protein